MTSFDPQLIQKEELCVGSGGGGVFFLMVVNEVVCVVMMVVMVVVKARCPRPASPPVSHHPLSDTFQAGENMIQGLRAQNFHFFRLNVHSKGNISDICQGIHEMTVENVTFFHRIIF